VQKAQGEGPGLARVISDSNSEPEDSRKDRLSVISRLAQAPANPRFHNDCHRAHTEGTARWCRERESGAGAGQAQTTRAIRDFWESCLEVVVQVSPGHTEMRMGGICGFGLWCWYPSGPDPALYAVGLVLYITVYY
jgi:hypothetical protein